MSHASIHSDQRILVRCIQLNVLLRKKTALMVVFFLTNNVVTLKVDYSNVA